MPETLKGCPFCGRRDVRVSQMQDETHGAGHDIVWHTTVGCTWCDVNQHEEDSDMTTAMDDEVPEKGYFRLSPALSCALTEPRVRGLSVRACTVLANADLRSLHAVRALLANQPDGLLRVNSCGPRIAAFIKDRVASSPEASASDRVPHPESPCEKCGGDNVTWFAPSPLWNDAVRTPQGPGYRDWMLCPVCFIKLAEQHGVSTAAWRVFPSEYNGPDDDSRLNGSSSSHPAGEGAPTDAVEKLVAKAERFAQGLKFSRNDYSASAGLVLDELASSLRSARDRIGGLEWEVDGLESDLTLVMGERDAALSRVEELERAIPCGVCLGKPLASGRDCVCNGVGTEQAEMQGLRELAIELDQAARGAFLKLREEVEAELAKLRHFIKTKNPAVAIETVDKIASLLDRATTKEANA